MARVLDRIRNARLARAQLARRVRSEEARWQLQRERQQAAHEAVARLDWNHEP